MLNAAIAVPLVMEPTDNGVLACRLDPRSGRLSIESAGAGDARKAMHMTAQAGKLSQARYQVVPANVARAAVCIPHLRS